MKLPNCSLKRLESLKPRDIWEIDENTSLVFERKICEGIYRFYLLGNQHVTYDAVISGELTPTRFHQRTSNTRQSSKILTVRDSIINVETVTYVSKYTNNSVPLPYVIDIHYISGESQTFYFKSIDERNYIFMQFRNAMESN